MLVSQAPSHLPERNLDLLRAVAVLCVVVAHATDPWYDAVGPLRVWELGQFGVRLFFVHTSLVLMASLERLARDGPSMGAWVRRFYVRRAFRIYPLAMATVLWVAVASTFPQVRAVSGESVVPTFGLFTIVANLALVQNLVGADDVLPVLWSLPVEVQMYVLLPGLYIVARRPSRWMAGAFVVAIIAAFVVWTLPIPGVWRISELTSYGPCFLSGILAYHILIRTDHRISARWWPVILASVGALFIALDANATTQQWRTWIPCIALGAAIPWVHNMTLNPITRAAAIVAKYSYGIYLVHGPAFWYAFMYHKELPRAVQWPLWLLLTAAISALAYHLIEAPCIRLGVRLASGRRAPVPTPTMSPAP